MSIRFLRRTSLAALVLSAATVHGAEIVLEPSAVQKAVRTMLQSASSQLQVDVQSLNIEAVRIADNRLSVRFDFKVAGR